MPNSIDSMADKWAKGFTDAQARALTEAPPPPVAGVPLKDVGHTGPWCDITQLQIHKLPRDIRRA
jgi:hypothetical protein